MTKAYEPGFEPDEDIIRRANILLRTDNLQVCLDEFVMFQLDIVRRSSPTDQESRENAYHLQRGAEQFVSWIEGMQRD